MHSKVSELLMYQKHPHGEIKVGKKFGVHDAREMLDNPPEGKIRRTSIRGNVRSDTVNKF